jgi:hypothetical protein
MVVELMVYVEVMEDVEVKVEAEVKEEEKMEEGKEEEEEEVEEKEEEEVKEEEEEEVKEEEEEEEKKNPTNGKVGKVKSGEGKHKRMHFPGYPLFLCRSGQRLSCPRSSSVPPSSVSHC